MKWHYILFLFKLAIGFTRDMCNTLYSYYRNQALLLFHYYFRYNPKIYIRINSNTGNINFNRFNESREEEKAVLWIKPLNQLVELVEVESSKLASTIWGTIISETEKKYPIFLDLYNTFKNLEDGHYAIRFYIYNKKGNMNSYNYTYNTNLFDPNKLVRFIWDSGYITFMEIRVVLNKNEQSRFNALANVLKSLIGDIKEIIVMNEYNLDLHRKTLVSIVKMSEITFKHKSPSKAEPDSLDIPIIEPEDE